MLRRLLWPGLMTVIMLALTSALGAWQLERLAWKTALLQEIDRGGAAPGVPLTGDPKPFTKVRVAGRLRQDSQALYGVEVRSTAAGPAMGAFLLSPLDRPGLDPVIVDRGWVPLEAPRPQGDVDTVIEGYVRAPEMPVRFGAKDDPVARRFYALDPAAIADSLGIAKAAPFTLVALGHVPPGTYPEPADTLPRPPNNHLSYAITWFGLAASLLVIFAVYARQALRSPRIVRQRIAPRRIGR